MATKFPPLLILECIAFLNYDMYFLFSELFFAYFQIIKMECQAMKNEHLRNLFLFAFNQVSTAAKAGDFYQ